MPKPIITVTGKCSKNYINCRRHPVRTLPEAQRVQEDTKYARGNAKGERTLAEQALAKAVFEKRSATVIKNYENKLAEAEMNYQALQSDMMFKRWADTNLPDESDAAKLKRVQKATIQRFVMNEAITKNVQKEMALQNAEPLDSFKSSIASLMVDEGEIFQPNSSAWGESRGNSWYAAETHLRTECHVALIQNYDEHASWGQYDTFSSTDYVGVKADLSCACGKVYQAPTYLPSSSMGSIISRLMNR